MDEFRTSGSRFRAGGGQAASADWSVAMQLALPRGATLWSFARYPWDRSSV